MLKTKNISIAKSVDARKEKIVAEQAWEILQKASEIIIAKGKKTIRLSPNPTGKEAILSAALGRSGTLRAPTLQLGSTIMVGFNQELYDTEL